MKSLKYLAAGALVLFTGGLSVSAATICSNHGDFNCWENRDWESEVTTAGDVITIKLTGDSDAGLQVPAGKKVVLDLNDHELTNWCDGDN